MATDAACLSIDFNKSGHGFLPGNIELRLLSVSGTTFIR